MSLTKQRLFELAKPRFAFVDVPIYGKVAIRSVSRLRASQREASYRDPQTGELIAEEIAKADLYTLIDQVMISETEPMFTDDDLETLASFGAEMLVPLFVAVNEFNGEQSPGKASAASNG